MESYATKILCGVLVLTLTIFFGYLPVLISKKFPLLSPKDPSYCKKDKTNIVFSFLLNFGGGALFANSFCHWLPEVREGNLNHYFNLYICLSFFLTMHIQL